MSHALKQRVEQQERMLVCVPSLNAYKCNLSRRPLLLIPMLFSLKNGVPSAVYFSDNVR